MGKMGSTGYGNKASRSMAWEFVYSHLLRAPAKSVLSMIIAIVFIFAMGFISMLIFRNEQEIDNLYKMAEIDAELVPSDSMAWQAGDSIHIETINDLLKIGCFQNINIQLDAQQALWLGEEKVWDSLAMRALAEEQPLPFQWKETTISYAHGWNASCFSVDWGTLADPLPIFVNEGLLAQAGLKMGAEVLLTQTGISLEDTMLPDAEPAIPAVIAGTYIMQERIAATNSSITTILFPLSGVARFTSVKGYASAEFVINPNYNRTLGELSESTEKILNTNHGKIPFRLLIWDEEIRTVVKPMERTLSLLSVLYPVTTAIAAGIATVLACLMVFQNAKTAAIMRVTGMDKRRSLWVQVMEQMMPCVIGLLMGLLLCVVLLETTETSSFLPLLLRAGLYLTGCAVGSLIAGLSTTSRAPLDLLQVKE